MNKLITFLFLLLFGSLTYAQSANCAGMEPICTAAGLTFDAQTGVPQAQFTDPGNNYGCLFSQPNPTWYYLEIATNGNIDMSLSAPSDIDFIIYGPYNNLAMAQADCNGMGTPAAEIIDCSYSGTSNETPSIPNATTGQVYVMLITNYANAQQQITLTQTGGTGSTDCSIVSPPCQIISLSATPSNCSSNTYSVSGQIQFSDAPSTGTLTVTNSCGGSQTFNAPFASPINYSLLGLTPIGGSCTITASFSDDAACSLTQLYNSPSIPIVNAGPDQTHCFSQTTSTLLATGATTYVWSGGLGTSPSITVTPNITTTYTVTGANIYGCTATDQVIVNVNALPNVNAGQDQTICDGDSVILNAIGAQSYTWDNGITNGIPFYPSITTIYTVTGSSVAGCTNTDQVTINVNPLPTVNAGIDIIACEGESIILTGTGADSYTWDNGILNGVPFTQNAGTISYNVVGTTLAGCIGTDQIDVTVISNPVPSFMPSITGGCVPLDVTFTNTTINTSECVWSFSNGQTSTDCNPTITFTQGGCYDVMLTTTNINNCIGSTTFTNLICVEENPVASFVPSSNDVSTLGTEVIFTNTTSGASTYVWNFGDGSQTTNIVNPIHVFPDSLPGDYIVTLIAYSPTGCVDTTWVTITVYEELIYYVPNTFTPDTDGFNPTWKPVFTSGFDPYDYTLLIFNRWGEIIFESHNSEIGWDGSYGTNGNIGICQDGIYIWKIEFKLNRWDERRIDTGHINLIR